MAKPFDSLTRARLQVLREEVMRNYRIRAKHLYDLAASNNRRYAFTINFGQGWLWRGNGDTLVSNNGAFLQANSDTALTGLENRYGCFRPVRESGSGLYEAGFCIYAKEAKIRVYFDNGDELDVIQSSTSYAYATASVAGGLFTGSPPTWNADRPIGYYVKHAGTNANPEVVPGEILMIVPFEVRLAVSNLP